MIKYSIKSLLSKKTISILFSLAIFIAVSISMLAINISSQIEEGFYQVDKKYDIKTMAAIKGVKPATIAGQIAKGIQLKKIDSDKYQRFIDREDYSRIVRLFQDGKLQLGTENLEDPIKVVIALAIYRLHFPNLKQ